MNRRRFLGASGAVVIATAATMVYWPERWRYIVIHHSAGNYATIDLMQFHALVLLTRQLMDRYGIPVQNVGFHGLIDGESTICPGRRFPFEAFTQAIA